MLKKVLLVFIVLLFVWLVAGFVRMRMYSSRAGAIIRSTTPFERQGSDKQKILVLGDSLAYGTGTSKPEHSVAGLIAARYPNASVENHSQNGKRTNELANEVKTVSGHYDLILIIIGGNDVMRPWIDLNESGKNLDAIYAAASRHADKVVAFSTGNMSTTTFFPWPLNHFIGQRSLILRDHAQQIAHQHPNVFYVDVASYNKKVPFTHQYEAADHLHLNDAGAQYWLDALLEKNVL